LVIASIAIVGVFVVVSIGLFVSAVRAERQREKSHERLFALLEYLTEQREASLNDGDVDLDKLMEEGTTRFAAELPHVPTFIAIIEPKKSMLAENGKRWINDLLKGIPAGTDLSPLDEIPASSFASAAIQERRGKG